MEKRSRNIVLSFQSGPILVFTTIWRVEDELFNNSGIGCVAAVPAGIPRNGKPDDVYINCSNPSYYMIINILTADSDKRYC